ncbi:MAG TPA: AAA family ATPase [Phycisphaerae bacterium]|nr:AAA family ATPase [Phycisphaerales bacterium]HRX85930.1 AAA family ATPase [Phycisphaerae bacterium]
MSAVRIVVFNSDDSFAAPLRSTLLGLAGVKIIAEVDEPALLPQALERFRCDLLVAHLDPAPETVLPVLAELAAGESGVPIFAVSESTDGQLILSAMRSGIREFLTKPIDGAVLAEAIGKVASTTRGAEKHGALITVIGGAGGVGATTLAVNLAVELSELAAGSVAVVDLDHRFGQVATALDVEPTYTMADLCDSPEQLERQMIERALMRHDSGTRVLSRPLHFAQADNITAAHCVGVLSALTAIHDYVVVDGPTRFDYGSKAVLDIADYNLLVFQLVVPTVRSVHRMLGGMREVGFNLDRMRLLCNRVGCEGGGITLDDVNATLGMDVFAQIPDDWVAVNQAMNVGEPLATAAPKSKVRQAIRSIAQMLHDPEGEAAEAPAARKRGGLFSKIF